MSAPYTSLGQAVYVGNALLFTAHSTKAALAFVDDMNSSPEPPLDHLKEAQAELAETRRALREAEARVVSLEWDLADAKRCWQETEAELHDVLGQAKPAQPGWTVREDPNELRRWMLVHPDGEVVSAGSALSGETLVSVANALNAKGIK